MLLSEGYKERLQKLAGIVLLEVSNAEKEAAFRNSNQRIPFNKDLMIQAIKEGREIGILFQSNNEKYKMPVSKYRIIYPVAIGTSKAGNQVLRAVHRMGQSESAAMKTGLRSQEIEDEWRMFKISNIKSMWFTGNFFSVPPKNYNAADKGMVNVEVAANFPEIKKFQIDLANKAKEQQKPKPNIKALFKEPEQQVQEPEQTDAVTKPTLKPKGTIKPIKNISNKGNK